MRRPNVLFFLADDQQFDTIRALGNPAIHTPSLDRQRAAFGDNGAFGQHHGEGAGAQPSCGHWRWRRRARGSR